MDMKNSNVGREVDERRYSQKADANTRVCRGCLQGFKLQGEESYGKGDRALSASLIKYC